MEVQDQIASSISRQMRKAKRKLQLVKCDRCRHDKQKVRDTVHVLMRKTVGLIMISATQQREYGQTNATAACRKAFHVPMAQGWRDQQNINRSN